MLDRIYREMLLLRMEQIESGSKLSLLPPYKLRGTFGGSSNVGNPDSKLEFLAHKSEYLELK